MAAENYRSGNNCAQSVMKAFLEICEVESSNFIKMTTGFGGGISMNEELCGALAGGIIALSLACGTSSPNEKRKKCYKIVNDYYQNFINELKSTKCKELNIGDFTSPEHIKNCSHISGISAKLLIETMKKFELI